MGSPDSKKKTSKHEKTRCRGSRVSGQVEGVPGGVQGGPEVLGRKTAKNTKNRKTLRNCMASLLRSNIHNFVQEVPVGQMAQGTPFSSCWKGEVKPPKCPTRHPRVGGFSYTRLLE